MDNKSTGHISALITILIWGTTFISTKILLNDFKPVEILIFRFILGFLILFLLHPKNLKTTKKEELLIILAGLSGICLYYLLENIALTMTTASNVGIIVSATPFFTALFTHFFIKSEEKLKTNFIIGFIIAMAGIFLINFNSTTLELNPFGDLFALLAAVVFAIYSVLIKKINKFNHPTILTTRKTFFWGIIFMIPCLFFFDFHLNLSRFLNPTNLFNMLYLGICACALCFVTWNYSLKVLGAIKTSTYIYLIPIVTIIFSFLILQEKITILSIIGTILTLLGLFISQFKRKVS